MKKNDLLKKDDMIVRVLDMNCDKVLIINCINKTMPEWVDKSFLDSFVKSSESELMMCYGLSIYQYMNENDRADLTYKKILDECQQKLNKLIGTKRYK